MTHRLIVAGIAAGSTMLVACLVLFGYPLWCMIRRAGNWRRFRP